MRIHHLAMRTRQLAAMEVFYTQMLRLDVSRRAPGRIWLDAGGIVLMIEEADVAEPAIPAGSLELVAFAIDASEREAFRARVAVEAETPFTLYFRDPDGRRIALSHYAF